MRITPVAIAKNLCWKNYLVRWEMKGKITISREFCKGCEICISFCPKKAISLSSELNSNGYLVAVFGDSEECTGCAVCATVCPEAAIEVYRV